MCGNPPTQQDLVQAGVWWLNRDWNNYDDVNDDEDYSDNVYFTRLHVRYNREKFPQDLVFQVTPNTENYQARYVITHPATGDFNCEAGKKYLKELKERRKNELEQLAYLTGKTYENWDMAYEEEKEQVTPDASYSAVAAGIDSNNGGDNNMMIGSLIALSVLGFILLRKKQKILLSQKTV